MPALPLKCRIQDVGEWQAQRLLLTPTGHLSTWHTDGLSKLAAYDGNCWRDRREQACAAPEVVMAGEILALVGDEEIDRSQAGYQFRHLQTGSVILCRLQGAEVLDVATAATQARGAECWWVLDQATTRARSCPAGLPLVLMPAAEHGLTVPEPAGAGPRSRLSPLGSWPGRARRELRL